VAAWQAAGGAGALHLKMLELDGSADVSMQSAAACGSVLSVEDANLSTFLSQSEGAKEHATERVALCRASGIQLSALQARLAKLQAAWVGGREADEKLLRQATLEDPAWLEGAGLLAMAPREALTAELARAASEAQQQVVQQNQQATDAAAGGPGAQALPQLPSSPGNAKALKESLLVFDDGGSGGSSGGAASASPALAFADPADRLEVLRTAALKEATLLLAALSALLSRVEDRDSLARTLSAQVPRDPFNSGGAAAGGGGEAARALREVALAVAAGAAGGKCGGSSGKAGAGVVGAASLSVVRSCVSVALESLRLKMGLLDTALASGGDGQPAPVSAFIPPSDGPGEAAQLSEAAAPLSAKEQEALLCEVKALHARFAEAQAAHAEALAPSANSGGSSGGVVSQLVLGEHERRVSLLESTLCSSARAHAHLDQGMRWYGDLASRLDKLKLEAEDHQCGQQLLRADFGFASDSQGQHDEDALFAQKMQDEMQRDAEGEYQRHLEQQHEEGKQQLEQQEQRLGYQHPTVAPLPPPSPEAASATQAAAAAVSDKTQLATKVPEGVGPGGRIKIVLPGSGREIELEVPPGMSPGDNMEFLVPNSLLAPPEASNSGIVILPKAGAPPVSAPEPPPYSAADPSPSVFPRDGTGRGGGWGAPQALPSPDAQYAAAAAPPPLRAPQREEDARSQRVQPGMTQHAPLQEPLCVPDYSQSARSYSSDPPTRQQQQQQQPLEQFTKGVDQAVLNIRNFFGGSTPSAQQQQTQARPQQSQYPGSRPPVPIPATPQQPQQPPPPPVVLDAGAVQMLTDMGFAKEAATAALVANHGDSERALNALLSADETAALRASMS